jgi:polar amino acid transport system substrate-binding protein
VPRALLRCALPLAASVLALPAAGQTTLVLNAAGAPPFVRPDGTGFTDVIATEAFRRIGLAVQVVNLPAERALRLADEGHIDGEVGRVGGLEAQYPNLARVPEPIARVEFAAFSRNPALPADFAVLRTHAVGLVRGWKYFEQAMAGGESVVTASDPEQLFRLLELGRVDVALYERSMGTALLMTLGIRDVRPLDPVLARRDVYTYLNRRHAALVSPLAEALRAMKRDGFYAKARREILDPYLGRPR